MYTNIILYVVFKQIRYISYGILLFDARHYFVKVQRCQETVHLRGVVAVLLVKIVAATVLRKKRIFTKKADSLHRPPMRFC